MNPMKPTTTNILDQINSLLAKEMHLIGQGLDDALSGPQSRDLKDLTAVLNRIGDMVKPRQKFQPLAPVPMFAHQS
jgi:hypothetical protein